MGKNVVLACFLLAALAQEHVATGTPDQLMGTATVTGPVFLNGQLVRSVASLGNGDRLETGRKGGAILTISGKDGLVLDENSEIALRSRGGGIAAELKRGRVLVTSSHERMRELRLAGEAVSIRAAPGMLRRYQVSRLPDATYVLARVGKVSVYDEGYATHTEVPEGKVGVVRPEIETLSPPSISAEQQAAAAAAGGRRAGQVSRAIPKDYILRGTQQTEGNSGDLVLWNDTVRTEPRGRVRLALDDGSVLNVGSDSRLQVLQHDSQTQQTQLQMQYGRLRAQVIHLAQPNSKFEIRTNTAVCGVLGTDFYLEATEKSTRVIVFKGVVRLTALAAGAVAGVAVGAGQASTAAAGSVSTPATASVAQIQAAATATQASTQAAQAAVVASTAASRVGVVAATAAPAAAVTAVAVPTLTQSPASPTRP
jgi:ferric-dicitrate binding protein FerR (iron transport regulator)